MGKDSGNVTITPREALNADELVVIGRIVRASADLEDCLNLWICKLMRCDEAASAVILGRSNISTKIAIAKGLAQMHGKGAHELHEAAFGSPVDQLLSCRNAVAHGAFAGDTDDGYMLFVTNVNVGYKEANLERRADAYNVSNLEVIALGAERLVGRLDDRLGLGALRKKRLWQHAPARPMDQPKGKRGAKPKPPQKPSRA